MPSCLPRKRTVRKFSYLRKTLQTKVMTTGKKLSEYEFSFGNHKIEEVTSFKYLGIDSQKNGRFITMANRVAKNARAKTIAQLALGAGRRRCTPRISAKLWQAILYGAEVYSMTKTQQQAIERTQRSAARIALGVNKTTTNVACLGELGWLSIHQQAIARRLNFADKIKAMPNSRTVKKIYQALPNSKTCQTTDLQNKYSKSLKDLHGTKRWSS